MTTNGILLIAALIAPLMITPATAQAQGIRSETVQFASGTTGTTIADTITGEEIIDYKLGAAAGQTLAVELSTSNASAYFNIMAPAADAALFVGSTDGLSYSGTLSTAGDYTVRVYLMRNAARRNESAAYDLAISVTGPGEASSSATLPADFADALAGGPDFWEVANLSAGDTLNLRAAAGTGSDIVAKLAAGDVLENLGCAMTGKTRWCQVKRSSDGLAGWVSGHYLKEAAMGASQPQAAPQPQANGLTGNGEPFSATGQIPCATASGQPTRNCAFGVVRTDIPGNASVWVGIADGQERFIMFENGNPSFTDAADAPVADKSGDLSLITIGQERYEIPDAVIFGG